GRRGRRDFDWAKLKLSLAPGERRQVKTSLFTKREGLHCVNVVVGDRIVRAAAGVFVHNRVFFDDLLLEDEDGRPFRARFGDWRQVRRPKIAGDVEGMIVTGTARLPFATLELSDETVSANRSRATINAYTLSSSADVRVLNWIPRLATQCAADLSA